LTRPLMAAELSPWALAACEAMEGSARKVPHPPDGEEAEFGDRVAPAESLRTSVGAVVSKRASLHNPPKVFLSPSSTVQDDVVLDASEGALFLGVGCWLCRGAVVKGFSGTGEEGASAPPWAALARAAETSEPVRLDSGTSLASGSVVGPAAVVEASWVGSHVLIGRGARLGPGCVVGDHAVVMPGAVVHPLQVVPPFAIVSGGEVIGYTVTSPL
jgi:carbonic anhydrase/acetyltransferase-like protein (isoleucine patch superfamily)